ncbi:hypothetical protein KP509_30G053400 [Ceratopteris richardii]|nr:hypothetical protein KP509_30G053400 [Ceratopteris richardii]
MLDHLYTLQYQLRGILTVSLGSNIANENMNGCTHGLFMRFPSKEALGGYYESPARWRVEHDYIFPYYNGMICIDYEAEVEDDIEPIFRRGEVFEEGVESLMLLQVKPDVDPSKVKEGLNSVSHLVDELGTLVVQHTSGLNIGELGKGYTHGMVTRFLSEEARDIFMQHPHYVEIVETKLKPNFLKMLTVEFNVAPVGTTAL